MKKVSLWSFALLLILLLYFVATIVFSILFQGVARGKLFNTRTPEPTFTMTPPPTTIVIEATPIAVDPTLTPTLPSATSTTSPTPAATAPETTPTDPPLPTDTSTPAVPQVVADSTVNIRSGPGTDYTVVGVLPPNVSLPIVGQNEAGTWWKVEGPDGSSGWVAGSVVEASNAVGVPLATAPLPPATSTPDLPTPTPKPAYQYEPTGWYNDTNYGLTRFLGTITDVNGNPVDGVRIEAQCGSFRIISNPSGPVGDGVFNESWTWPPGFYDLTLDNRPIPCKWLLTVVATTEDGDTVTARLSEAVEVETTVDASIVTANWRKNW
jgi:hypothetical protein